MEHPECGDGRLTAQGEVAVARLALHSDNLSHAAAHLADALLADPQLPAAHEALAQLCARAGGPAEARALFPLDGEVYLGTLVCRAHVEAAAGDLENAVGMLASAIRFDHSRPWAGAAWLTAPETVDRLEPDSFAQAVSRVNSGLPDQLPEERRTVLRPFEELTRALAARHPEHVLLLAMASGLVRRLGDTAEAVRLAEQAQRIDAGHLAAVMLGNALRADGRPAQALQVWETELAREFDGYLAVDVAELYGATGRPAEGLPWLERALATDPAHPKAAPARHGLRYCADGDRAHLLALHDHHRAHPDHGYAPELLAELCRRQPWLGMVHGASEATVNVLHQFLEAPGTERHHELECTASQLEPPSSALALRLAFPNATIGYGSLPEPDPRLTLRQVTHRIWQFDGLAATPAVPPPAPAAAELIRATAAVSWSTLPAAYDHAVRLAGLPVADLLGAMAHPPLPPEDELGRALLAHQPELWVRAVQSFACLGLAHHRTDQPWPESERRRVLADLLLGAEDWVVEAAGLALVAIAWTDPGTREDIGTLLAERLADAARSAQRREVTILRSLGALMLCCPWADRPALDLARGLDGSPGQPALPAVEEERRRRFGRLFRRG
ncbi:tetratricopeptide repeat protein [Kitasatospora sp. NPDC006697]|uniref:tetratricopeptide repeat protein n=1 Tax=Kitasatospora sp. NPDC006697 TaxID=3364020 RepID=UPI00369DC65D